MAHGNWTGTGASAALVVANANRDCLIIQKTNATAAALGLGVAAESGKGVQLVKVGDTLVLRGAQAREAVNVIGNSATGVYAEVFGDASFTSGPHVP
jgi:hypothetical protein